MNPTPEEANRRKQYVKENWFTKSNIVLANDLRVSESSIRKIAKRLNLPTKTQIAQETHSLFALKLEENNLPKDWSYGWLKGNEASIFVKNPQGGEDIEKLKTEWLESIKKKAPVYKKFEYKKLTEQNLMIIDPADVHIGKLAHKSETGETYNVEIALKRMKDGVTELLNKTQGFPTEKIVLVIGNDILHTDTPHRTTTAGTAQDTDGMWFDNYKKAHAMYVEILEQLQTLAPVHVVHCPSNHDWTSGFFLAQSIEAYFHNSKNITFDVSIGHRKYFKYGRNLLGFTHGDGAKEGDLVNIMANESKTLWAETDFRYWYLHHKHHMNKIHYKDGKDYIGGTIEYLRAVSGGDGWHDRNGYLAPQSIYCFIHSNDGGQVGRIMHHFN